MNVINIKRANVLACTFKLKLTESFAINKRKINRLLSSLWEPLGILAPILIIGNLCLLKVYKISKELKLFENIMKKLNEKSKHLSIHWDTNLRELKLPISQRKEQLNKLLMDWDDLKVDLLKF